MRSTGMSHYLAGKRVLAGTKPRMAATRKATHPYGQVLVYRNFKRHFAAAAPHTQRSCSGKAVRTAYCSVSPMLYTEHVSSIIHDNSWYFHPLSAVRMAVMAPAVATYAPRDPSHTVLYRIACRVSTTGARLATGVGGLTLGRVGFAPTGRRTTFHGDAASSHSL
jgi:hypothetical protein